MYTFNSFQIHINGNKKISESVHLKNNVGFKKVSIGKQGGKSKTKKIRLSKKEIQNIKNKVFMPKLFDECHNCITLRNSTRRVKKTTK